MKRLRLSISGYQCRSSRSRQTRSTKLRYGRKNLLYVQLGNAAIEFAFVFLIFFAIFYGIVSYALPMLMLQAFHHAASAGARAAVAVDPTAFPDDPAGCTSAVTTVVRDEVGQLLNWLPPKANDKVLGSGNSQVGVGVAGCPGLVTVTVTYLDYTGDPLIPILINFPEPIGTIPKLPRDLTATASVFF